MHIEVKVPSLGESISQATISRIIKSSGSFVSQNDEILELETDKVNQVIYANESGKLNLIVKVSDEVRVGQVLGSIDTSVSLDSPKTDAGKPVIKPSLQELGSTRKMPEDVVKEMENPSSTLEKLPSVDSLQPSQASASSRKKMSALRRTIAEKLVEVKNTTAMLTTFNEVDMTKVIEIRGKEQEAFQKKYGIKLGFMSFFIKAVVSALKMFPQIHSYIDGEDIVSFNHFDIGIAVATDKGLVVPVVRKCDSATFGNIEQQIAELAKKSRDSKISLDELVGGCFTITNGGTFGSLLSTPILNPPQSAILGMHAILKRPVVINDQIVIRPMMYLALSYDHRLIDGRDSVQFLIHIKESIEEPSRLLFSL